MKGFLLRLIAIAALAAAGAGVHRAAAGGFRLEPAAPPEMVIRLPANAPTDDPGPDDAGPSDQIGAGDELRLDSFEINLATARALHDDALADFVDARGDDLYEAGHIAGAYQITPDMLLTGTPAAVDFLLPDRPIVIYCDGGDCTDSKVVAERLQSLYQLSQTHIYTGGFPEWAAAGLAVETGADPTRSGG